MKRLIPISIGPIQVHIHADRRLAFQVLTAFGAATQADGASSRVLSQENGRLLVEFHTRVHTLFGWRKDYRTVEYVTLHEPELVEFDTVEGPFAMMYERFTLQDDGGCTLLRYDGRFGLPGWLGGWILGVVYVRPLLNRFMRRHIMDMKEAMESRARRSRAFPQQPCATEVMLSP